MIRFLLFLCFLKGVLVSSQPAISGHLNVEKVAVDAKIVLAKLDMNRIGDVKAATSVTWSPLRTDGSFSFDKKYISDSEALYTLYVQNTESALKDSGHYATTFILSKTDNIRFTGEGNPLACYKTTSLAHSEWKKLRAFEAQLTKTKLGREAGETQLKNYTKDSLRILAVKLIGIKTLDEKDLLEQDIAKNSEFYLALLAELKASELPKEDYVFLERKLAFLTQEVVEEKYAWSKGLNYLLGFLVLGLAALFMVNRRQKPVRVPLSRQERNIQQLMVQGKTNKEIASELFISLSTVKSHITNIYGKLQVGSRQELLRKTQN